MPCKASVRMDNNNVRRLRASCAFSGTLSFAGGSGVGGELRANRWSCGPRLAQVRSRLGESARCVGEAGACRRVHSRHGSRQFEIGLAMAARRRLRTVMISWTSEPPNLPPGVPVAAFAGDWRPAVLIMVLVWPPEAELRMVLKANGKWHEGR